MVDEWIDILAGCSFQFDEDLDPWLEWVFLLWGEHWLPDVFATLEDGVAERDTDDIFAEFASQLDRYKTLMPGSLILNLACVLASLLSQPHLGQCGQPMLPSIRR